MTTQQPTKLLSERLFSALFRFLRRYRIPFFSALVFGFLSHMFTFTNKLLNHDELNFLFSKGITISSGRWGLVFLDPFLPDASLPWLNGTITLLLITISVCLIVHLFSIKNFAVQVVLSGLIVSSPALTGTFSYMFTSTYYGVAFLLSVAAVCLIRHTGTKSRYRYLCILVALSFSVFSTAIYQAYIAITAGLFVLLLIQQLLDSNTKLRTLLVNGSCGVLFLALSLGGYWICCKVIWSVTGIPMNQYSQDAVTFQLSTILENIKNAYLHFFSYTLHPSSGLIASPLSQYFHIACLAAVCAELLIWAIQTKRWDRFLLMVFLLTMLPLSINCMYIFIAAYHIHTLVLYSIIIVYIFVAIVIEHGLLSPAAKSLFSSVRRYAYDIIVLGLTAVLISSIYTANTAYLRLHLRYENFYAFCTSIVSQLQSTPEYHQDTPVAIVGTLPDPEFYSDSLPGTDNIVGVMEFSPNTYARDKMFEYYIGYKLNLAEDWQTQTLSQTPEVVAMPEYPAYGSIQMIDNTLVIKLSD